MNYDAADSLLIDTYYDEVNAPSSTDGATWFDFDSGYSGIKGYIVEYSPVEGVGGGDTDTGEDNQEGSFMASSTADVASSITVDGESTNHVELDWGDSVRLKHFCSYRS